MVEDPESDEVNKRAEVKKLKTYENVSECKLQFAELFQAYQGLGLETSYC